MPSDGLRALLGREMAAVGQHLDPHVIGVLDDVLEHPRREERILQAVQPERRRRQPAVGVLPAHPLRILVELEGAVDLRGGAGTGRVGHPGRELRRVLVGHLAARRDRVDDLADELRRLVDPPTDPRAGQQSLVGHRSELLRHALDRQRRPDMAGVHRHVALDAIGVVQADEEADHAAPVVADEVHPLDRQRVEHAGDVVGELLLTVAALRRLAPAEAAQVQREHAEAVGEQRHERAPAPPVLRPAVHEQDRRRIRATELDDVQACPAHVEEVMLHARQRGHVRVGGRHRRRLPGGWSTAQPSDGIACTSESTGAYRSPCSPKRATTWPASKTSRAGSPPSRQSRTSSQVTGVETVGRSRARSE